MHSFIALTNRTFTLRGDVMSSIRYCAIVLVLLCLHTNFAQEPAKPKVKVELRWVVAKPIEGVTEEDGIQTSCDPKSIMYPHKQPVLVLTGTEVASANVSHHDMSKNGLSANNYNVTIHLTKEAREKLAASTEGNEMKFLTVTIDGKHWGLIRYEKDKNKQFVPEQCRAESFVATVGFFSSKWEAERVVDSFKR
jgi:hypothetical protein